MDKGREINWLKLILTFLIASFLFSIGMFIGYLAKELIAQATISIEEETRSEIFNLETISLIDSNEACNVLTFDLVSEKLDYLGELITTLEVRKGKYDSEVLELKKLYTSLEVRHMYLVKENNKNCQRNNTVIMFYYSNDKECQGIVEKGSFVLTYLRNKYDFVKVYSFDVDLKSDIVSILKRKYDVSGCQTIIVNEEQKFKNIENSEEFEKALFND